jgi:hypothetical protein
MCPRPMYVRGNGLLDRRSSRSWHLFFGRVLVGRDPEGRRVVVECATHIGSEAQNLQEILPVITSRPAPIFRSQRAATPGPKDPPLGRSCSTRGQCHPIRPSPTPHPLARRAPRTPSANRPFPAPTRRVLAREWTRRSVLLGGQEPRPPLPSATQTFRRRPARLARLMGDFRKSARKLPSSAARSRSASSINSGPSSPSRTE